MRPADQRLLHLLLADHASGTPLQWLHLEIAATFGAGRPSLLGRFLGLLLRYGRPGLLAPILVMLGLRGLAPYRLLPAPRLLPSLFNGASITLTGMGLVLALGGQNSSRQVMAVLLMLLGGLLQALLAWLRYARQAKVLRQRMAAAALELAPSEATLGLAGLLSAAGYALTQATEVAEVLAHDTDRQLKPSLAQQLALAQPAPMAAFLAGQQQGWLFALGSVAVAWPCWFSQHPAQIIGSLLGLLACGYVSEGERGWRHVLRRCLLISVICGSVLGLRYLI